MEESENGNCMFLSNDSKCLPDYVTYHRRVNFTEILAEDVCLKIYTRIFKT
jgi:hypothetical protein